MQPGSRHRRRRLGVLPACLPWVVGLAAIALVPSCRCAGRPDGPGVRIGGQVWKVELATDLQSRRRGLAGRAQVPEGTGMLFVFDRPEVLSFHMLGCLVSLDIAFISDEGEVVDIQTMPVEQNPLDPRNVYVSRRPAKFALEVAAGAFERAGVKPGDRVEMLGPAADAAKATP